MSRAKSLTHRWPIARAALRGDSNWWGPDEELVRRRRRWILGYLALYLIAIEAIAASRGDAKSAITPLIGLAFVSIVWAVAGPTLIRVIAAYIVAFGLLYAVVRLLDLGGGITVFSCALAVAMISLIVFARCRPVRQPQELKTSRQT